MKLKGEIEDLVLNYGHALQEAEDVVNPVLEILADVLDHETFSKVESAVNVGIYIAGSVGFQIGYRFAQDPTPFIFEPDLSDANVDRTTAALLNQIGD